GGRTAVTLTCGLIGYRRRTFVAATAVAGVVWGCYAFFIGRLGGQAFESRPWVGLLLALGIALAVSALIELARRLHLWRRLMTLYHRLARRPGPEATDDTDGIDGTGSTGSTGSEPVADEPGTDADPGQPGLTAGRPDQPG